MRFNTITKRTRRHRIIERHGDIFKQMSVKSYPTMIAFENCEEIYRGSDNVAFCQALGVSYQRKVLQRADRDDYIEVLINV